MHKLTPASNQARSPTCTALVLRGTVGAARKCEMVTLGVSDVQRLIDAASIELLPDERARLQAEASRFGPRLLPVRVIE